MVTTRTSQDSIEEVIIKLPYNTDDTPLDFFGKRTEYLDKELNEYFINANDEIIEEKPPLVASCPILTTTDLLISHSLSCFSQSMLPIFVAIIIYNFYRNDNWSTKGNKE